MPEEFVTHREHEEFARRIDDEAERQSQRISELERGQAEIHAITLSVEKLAANMESMLKEMDRQGKRLTALESRDGDRWRTIVSYLITAVLGIVVGLIFKMIGM